MEIINCQLQQKTYELVDHCWKTCNILLELATIEEAIEDVQAPEKDFTILEMHENA